ncbi:ATP synthase subunit delta, sodium ion specific [bioreactor metagenome]|uniref:ATP synthase subunit delta, sodium ion specific n=1 Tax=bioreactor metagenome TaxID=1076179 RepID=A0A645DWD7_9ZZZZ
MDEAFAGKVAPYLLNTLRLLCERAQANQLPQAAVRYRERYNKAHGIIEARAFTAQPLGEALQQKLVARLAALTGKQVLLTVQTDPALLGGIRLEMEGKEFDGTVRRRLDTLRRDLLRAN